MEERYLSLSEATRALGISERTAYRWIKSGKLRAYKPGRDYRIPESAIKEAVEESEVRPKAESRASLEPSFNDVIDERRLSRFADAIVLAAERWGEAMSRPDTSDGKRFGFIDAAFGLSGVIAERAEGEDWEALTYQEQLDIVTTMEKLVEAANLGLDHIRESTDREEQDRRAKESREQIREWTRRLNLSA